MHIGVGPLGFEWEGRTSRRLWGPIIMADIEPICVMRLLRNGQVFDTAEIRSLAATPLQQFYGLPDTISPHQYWAAIQQFYGLQKVFGTPYNRNLVAGRFALGDRLEIDLPDTISPHQYWAAMQDIA